MNKYIVNKKRATRLASGRPFYMVFSYYSVK